MANLAQIIQFVAVPHYERSYAGGFDFDWSVKTSGFSPTFQIQTQEAEGEDWIDLLDSPVSTPYVQGIGPGQLSFQGDGHFRLLILDGSTVVAQSNPIDARYQMNRWDWLNYREILRRERLQIEKLDGIPGWLLRRIVDGYLCINCRDSITGAVMTTECDDCYGTGFVGGYYEPFPEFIAWKVPPPGLGDATREEQGESEAAQTVVKMSPFPHVKFEDIIVDRGTGIRFSVIKSDPKTFRSAPYRQMVTLSLLPPTHPAYNVPIPGL